MSTPVPDLTARPTGSNRAGPHPAACAIIPARGGSKGIPGKNLRPVGGIPLVARAIHAAARLARVVVTTDDAAIALEAARHGAQVVMRPAEIAGDTASSESALLHALETLRAEEGYAPEVVAFLQCTSPFTRPEDVANCLSAVAEDGADSAFTGFRSFHFLWRRTPEGDAIGINHDKARRPRRQERAPEFIENGAVYAFRHAGFLAARHRFFGRTAIVEMEPIRSLEIDDPADLLLAEALAPLLDAAKGR